VTDYPLDYPHFIPGNKSPQQRFKPALKCTHGLDGPGIVSQWRRDFPHLFRPALGPTQPHVQSILGLSWE